MQESNRFWLRDDEPPQQEASNAICGQLTDFIHSKEENQRALSPFECVPKFVMVACYTRNREYNAKIVRTPLTLQRCCEYLLKTVLPLVEDPKYNKLEVLEFVQNRLRAIRCEYHVQSRFDPELYYTLIKFHLFVLSMVADTSQLRTTMDTYLNESFDELLNRPLLVLCLLLLETSTGGYLQTLARLTQEQLEMPHVQRAILIANSVMLDDFCSYFKYLGSADFYEASLLYLFVNRMRVLAVRTFAKAQINLPVSYLRELLFFDSEQAVLAYLNQLGYKNLKEVQAKLEDPAADSLKIFVPMKHPQAEIDDEIRCQTTPKRLHNKRSGKALYDLLTQY